jgi:hypothetical protein
MIKFSCPRDSSFVILRQRGAQAKFDIVAIANELARFERCDGALRILFDWSELESWPYEPAAAIEGWYDRVPSIARAAFIHYPKWNRHAALLAALLRVGKAEVRSFRPLDYDRAVNWLRQGATNIRFH